MEYHFKYSENKELGTYHEEVTLLDWQWAFYCPNCGIKRRSPCFSPVQKNYPMQDRWVLATHEPCEFRCIVIFDQMLENLMRVFPKYHSSYFEMPTMDQIIQKTKEDIK